ncbi:hypothetical protein LR48_Vigan10g009900 [Vigna angularis]|uniref:TF-B3 domain-containing protein n=1 Tax=Phaseolus angularis TaxID=3914 RepID=A0A0L9VH07_PHAAN|nr:hypothetical protein LR48_Vigan10g009900 [Vigna angularis]
MAGSSSNSGRAKSVVEGNKHAKEIQFNDELHLEFILDAGIVKDCELSLPYGVQLTNDKWNLFLPLLGFEETLIGFLREEENVRKGIEVKVYDKGCHEYEMMLLKEEEDVRKGIEVKVYDRGGHEFEMMLKKWVIDSNQFYVLNRGWFSFCNEHGLGQGDLVALRAFRHSITDMLCFVVTFRRMR